MLKISLLPLALPALYLFQLLNGLEAARILALFGIPSPVENIFGSSLLNALNARGHNVTVIIRFSHHMQLHENIRRITIDGNSDILKDFLTMSAENLDSSLSSKLQKFHYKTAALTANVLKNPQVKQIVREQQYDLIMIDSLMSEGLYGLGEYLSAPMVGVAKFFYTENLDTLTANFSPRSIVPSVLLQPTFDSNFRQRVLNVALYVFEKLGYGFFNLRHQRQAYRELFPCASLTFEQAQRNFSLVLLNQHFSLSFPRPLMPNMIEVAGLHIDEHPAALPLHIQKFLNATNQAIIYVYLNIDTKGLEMQYQLHRMLKVFYSPKSLGYKIIWHNDYMPPEAAIYSNILQVANISHFSVLAHPLVRLFITNGEIENLIEAAHFGKPILGLPYFAHQHININIITAAGYGKGMKLRHLCEVRLRKAIVELLNNRSYWQKAKQLSKIFHDQPMKPKDKAIYWIEYVLRHNGAAHVMSRGRFLNIWQLHNIDVFLAYLVIFLLIVLSIILAMKCIYLIIHKIKNIF